MKKILLPVFSLLVCGLSFTSCDDSDNNVTPDAVGDVYVKTIKDGETTKYALYAYCSANYKMETVSIATPDDASIELAATNNPYTFNNYGDDENMPEFTETLPLEGKYTFNITSTDEEIMTRENTLSSKVVDIPVVTEAIIKDDKINVTWEEEDNNDAFILRLLDKDDNVIYSTPFLKDDTTTLEITNYTNGWVTDDYKIENVTKVKVLTVLFENSEDPDTSEIQSIGESTLAADNDSDSDNLPEE